MNITESLISEFKSLVDSGKSKGVALDILCENNKHLNPFFVRSTIRGADGWYY